jgi:hypothetical protein
MSEKYYTDYPKEPIGGGNPYHRCAYCHVSVPEINGDLEGHREWCEYRKGKLMEQEMELLRLEVECLKLDAQSPVYAVLWHWVVEGAGEGVDDSKMKLFRVEKDALAYKAELESSGDFNPYYHDVYIRQILVS